MKKQILYPKFITRIFSTLIDLLIISIISIFIMQIYHYIVGMIGFDSSKMTQFIEVDYLSHDRINFSASAFLIYIIIPFFINVMIMIFYYFIMWSKFQTTIGKYMMGMKIVHINYLNNQSSKISKIQIYKRLFFGIFFFIGIWYLLFSKNKQALHDNMSEVVVIKS